MESELNSLKKTDYRPLTDRFTSNYVAIERTVKLIEQDRVTTYRLEKEKEKANKKAGKQLVLRMAGEWQRRKGKENKL